MQIFWKLLFVNYVCRWGARTDPCGMLFLRRLNLLRGPLLVVRVKLLLLTSSMMNDTMCLSGRRLRSLQVRPRCQTES